MTPWFAIDVDGLVSGAGTTFADARGSALDTELAAVTDDDSAWHARNIDGFEAEVAARARRHSVVQMSLAASDIERLSKAFGLAPDSVVHGLIASAAAA